MNLDNLYLNASTGFTKEITCQCEQVQLSYLSGLLNHAIGYIIILLIGFLFYSLYNKKYESIKQMIGYTCMLILTYIIGVILTIIKYLNTYDLFIFNFYHAIIQGLFVFILCHIYYKNWGIVKECLISLKKYIVRI